MENKVNGDMKISTLEKYWRKASAAAVQFWHTRMMHPVLVEKWKNFRQRNAAIFELPPVTKTTTIMLIPLYLSTGLVEGLLLVPVLDASVFKWMQAGSLSQGIASILACLVLIGGSLASGYCVHKCRIAEDPLVAGRYSISWGWLFGAVFTGGLYLVFLYLLTSFVRHKITDLEVLVLIPVLGVIELILGIFAISGLVISGILLLDKWNYTRVLANSKRMMKLAGISTSEFGYYQLALKIYNRQNGIEIPERNSVYIDHANRFYHGEADGNDHSIPPDAS